MSLSGPQIAAPLATALQKKGYDSLTPVQEAVLAPEINEQDLLVSAQTGSGKTVAFGLALANSLLQGADVLPVVESPLALIIAPTRELALQVRKELEWLYAPAGGQLASCIGGMDIRDELRGLNQKPHIVVGTPGRLIDHIKRRSLDMSDLRAIVLDEADEMLNMGFREELESILDAAPEERRTLLFSATVSKPIARLAENYQNDALRLNTISAREQHIDIDYSAVVVSHDDVEKAVINLLLYHDAPNTLVFCSRRDGVNKLTARLNNRGFAVVALSGEFSQKDRSNALLAMRDGRARVCVATDVAARGIDLPGLDLVIHADLPTNKEALLHRSGRTGRAGRKGASALIVPVRAQRKAERLLRDAGVAAKWGTPPSTQEIQKVLDERVLSNPVLTDGIQETESQLVEALVARFDQHQLASAFVRLARQEQSLPEELQEPDLSRPKRDRDSDFRDDRPQRKERAPRGGQRPPEFQNGSWICLKVGRTKNADPKWLVPMLCKSGGFQRDQIGVIQITPMETFIELTPDAANQLMSRAGEKQIIDKSLYVERVSGPDQSSSDGDRMREPPRRPRSRDDRKDSFPPKRGRAGPKKPRGPNGEKKRRPK
ncbi:MAG: ATP-dependent RNA helicase [Ponticaulis sp.]|nr:ATP-dependent RNA helicase [Ponticaulis sp.]